jgi:pilus assembly protein Flp/PilA
MVDLLKQLRRDEEGASLVEYSILVGLVTAAVIALIVTIGSKVINAWTKLNTAWSTG